MDIFYSQQGEDFFIYRNFINQPNGIFLELGACDGITYSNTKFFEDKLNFKGILIEPVYYMFQKLIKNRPNCILVNRAISTKTENIKMLVNSNGPVSAMKHTINKKFKNKWHSSSQEISVKTIKLSQIINDLKLKYIDLFSLDVEGGELDVLQTINWKDIEIYLICIELDGSNPIKDDKCRKILIDNNFKFKIKICINEFWVNPNYSRKNILYKPIKTKFTNNLTDYGKHVFLEPHCKNKIENSIKKYEDKLY